MIDASATVAHVESQLYIGSTQKQYSHIFLFVACVGLFSSSHPSIQTAERWATTQPETETQ